MRASIFILLLALNGLLSAQTVSSFKTSDGETLYYTAFGNGPKVVLIPGGPGAGVSSLKMWADSLSNEFTCILFDQRGTGYSHVAKIDSTTINLKRATEDLDDLRKFLGEDKLTLCGISWGGQLSLAYASNFPGNTKKIVPVNTWGPDKSFDPIIEEILEMRRYPEEKDSLEFWLNQPASDLSKAKRSIFYTMPYFFDHAKGSRLLPKMHASRKFYPEMSSLMFKDIETSYKLSSKLKDYNNQIIIIRGRQDIVPVEAIFQLKELMPQTRVVFIEKCGHFPHLEQPNEFFKILREALRN